MTTNKFALFYAFGFLVLSMPTTSRADVADGAVEIWIRAFIPNKANAAKAADYIVPRPNSPGQSIVRLLPTDKLPDRATPACFVTDNRGFSAEAGTTARLETRFTLTPVTGGGKVTPASARTTAASTVEANCSTGAQVATAPGEVVRDTIGNPAVADGIIQVIGQVAPTIDYSFDFRWSPGNKQLKASVSYGSFPALEVYARAKGTNWKLVMRHSPTGSPWNLAGDALGINFERDEQVVVLN
jgi:hypothetical protein